MDGSVSAHDLRENEILNLARRVSDGIRRMDTLLGLGGPSMSNRARDLNGEQSAFSLPVGRLFRWRKTVCSGFGKHGYGVFETTDGERNHR